MLVPGPDLSARLIYSTTLRPPSDRIQAARIAWLRDTIIGLIREHKPDEIGAEFFGVAAGKNKQRASAIETVWLHGNVHVAIAEAGFPPATFIAPATLKKWMTGAGAKVEKSEIIEALETFYGVHVPEHNAADAACVAFMLYERARWRAGLPPLYDSDAGFSDYEIEKMRSWTTAFGKAA